MNSTHAAAAAETTQGIEHRRHDRHVVEMPGILTLQDTRGGVYAVTVLDVSQSGLRLSCPKSLPSGTRVEVKCQKVKIAGTVRYARDAGTEIYLGIEAELAQAGGVEYKPPELDLTLLFPKDIKRLRRG